MGCGREGATLDAAARSAYLQPVQLIDLVAIAWLTAYASETVRLIAKRS